MKKQDSFSTFFAIMILLGVLALIGYSFKLFFSHLDKINPNVLATIIAGMLTLSGYYVTRYLERKKEIEFQIRERKLPIYQDFIAFIFKMAFDEEFKALDENDKQKKMTEFVMEFSRKSMIWLSDEALLAYIKWKKQAANHSSDSENYISHLLEFEKVFLAFRKDVGHSNKNIQPGDLLAMFITDFVDYKHKA